jgi:hypothetical protein
MQLIHSSEKPLFFNTIPKTKLDLSRFACVEKFHHSRNQALALTTIHEEPFPLPHFYANGSFPSVTSVVQTNYLSHVSATKKMCLQLKK